MNYIWTAMLVLPILCGVFSGNADSVINAGLIGARDAVEVFLGFFGIMLFWSGIMRLCSESGIASDFGKILKPVIDRLFPDSEEASEPMLMNICANILGVGNAATPAGIEAMKRLDSANKHSSTPSAAMRRFLLMNTSSLQLIPTSIIAVRAAADSADPSAIIGVVWAASSLSLLCVLILERITR